MRSFLRPSRHVILTVVLLAVLAAVPFAGSAQAADQSLVLEALQVLQTHYVDPVSAAKVLNAAVAGLREQLAAAGIAVDMPEIPSSATETDARRQFGERFITATAAASGQLTKTQMAYAAIRSMTDSFHDSHTGFLTPEQNAERRQRQRGQAGFTGVGIVLLPKDERFYVWTVIPGGPAEAGTGRDVRNAMTRLLAGGMRVLVLDLRGNSGGYLHELDNVLNALLPSGVPVYTEMLQGGEVQVVRTTRTPLLQPSIPVVLMVDEGSASAAELLAAAIKENHRGVLVGAKTSGAVEASVMIDLSDGSALSVTTFRLATGRGVRLEGAGIEPDVMTALTVEDLEAGQDRQLTTAVRLARQAVAEPVH